MKDFFRSNGPIILIIAILLAALTAVGAYAFQGVPNPLGDVLGVVTTPVRNGISALAGWVEGVHNYSFHYDELQAANERLKAEIAELEAAARGGEADSKENERLRELLGLRPKERELDELESATVTARSSTNWSSTLTLSKGADQGVEAGDCVVDSAWNLVGIIDQVGTNWSTMLTVVDANLEMGAFLSRTESIAILEGDFSLMAEGKLKLTYLPENTELITGDLVLTSSMGGNYPSDLVVGSIESIHTDASGISRYAVIQPSADLSSLVQVFIIKEFNIVE